VTFSVLVMSRKALCLEIHDGISLLLETNS
jgi:hypothetical protein